ncbi:alpha/beta hydrolase [Mesorhizobium sp. BH1-1-4]|uniref:alpha/beta hydrolase n=1 Tax=Mesorhizobium sp. BH1-1-4 TaxID=2876662 RepID=UPI001CD112FE|nr:alpha/beta hydrolase [Mesorhizobium sp. BH1-1-4]MBZ9995240.1 alpha/beta hydrolase [Mesorhizobium sp. BH1-1-4]
MSKDPFRTRDHVADFDDIVADIVARSTTTRTSLPMLADVAYGPHEAERLDLFFPQGPRQDLPVHVFIHGGYWRMFTRSDYSYVAETVTGAGAIAVVIDYALMPAVRMAAIVDQIRRARQWVRDNIASHGGDPGRLSVSGHSAGAHLATFLFNEGSPYPPSAALLLGGLYDLKPLQHSFLEPLIGLTDTEVEAFSPMSKLHSSQTKVAVLVGERETEPFHLQARLFADRLTEQGLTASRGIVGGRNHMDSVRDLGLRGTIAGDWLRQLILAG